MVFAYLCTLALGQLLPNIMAHFGSFAATASFTLIAIMIMLVNMLMLMVTNMIMTNIIIVIIIIIIWHRHLHALQGRHLLHCAATRLGTPLCP